MSGRIAKSQIAIRPQATLPSDALLALIQVKNLLKKGKDLKEVAGQLKEFKNSQGNSPLEGPPLPDPALGCLYYEKQVGQARPGDLKGERGTKRLVVEVNKSSRQIMEVYYTEEHYEKFTFERIV